MAKLSEIEKLVLSVITHQGILGCAVASRTGHGEILLQSSLENTDPTLLNVLISSNLLIGERLGNELGNTQAEYLLINFGETNAIVVPGGEHVALLVLASASEDLLEIIASACEVAGKIAEVVRNKAG